METFCDVIDLHGLHPEVAMHQVRCFLSHAYRQGLSSVRIIHGKGRGILRGRIHQYLTTHPNVGDFFHPPSFEGGDGVTVVIFRR